MPVHSNNFSAKLRTKSLSKLSLKLILILPSENFIIFTLSKSYFNLTSFFFEVKEISPSIDKTFSRLTSLESSDHFFGFKVDKIGFTCVTFLIWSLELLDVSFSCFKKSFLSLFKLIDLLFLSSVWLKLVFFISSNTFS